jgi:hypothetical protein
LLIAPFKEAVDDGGLKGVLGGLLPSRQQRWSVGCRFHRIGAIRVIFLAKKYGFASRACARFTFLYKVLPFFGIKYRRKNSLIVGQPNTDLLITQYRFTNFPPPTQYRFTNNPIQIY